MREEGRRKGIIVLCRITQRDRGQQSKEALLSQRNQGSIFEQVTRERTPECGCPGKWNSKHEGLEAGAAGRNGGTAQEGVAPGATG